MDQLIEKITTLFWEQLGSNQFLSGGFVLMVLGAAAAICRNVPGRIWDWITHRAFIEFEIPMKDNAFYWFNDWLAEQPYSKNWARWLTVRTKKKKKNSYDGDENDTDVTIILSPAPGRHWLFWRGYFIIVDRERKENENGGGNGGGPSSGFSIPRETFNVSILSWRRSVVVELLQAACAFANPPEDDRVSIYIPCYGGQWDDDFKRRPRPLDSVILRDGVMGGLVEDVRTFLSKEEWYIERGIPYRRGYMLHGGPGNGKSSAVLAVCSELKLDICIVNLGTSSIGDDDLRKLFAEVPEGAAVLIEDIDCVFQQREQTKDNESKITFSGLLNAIDGVAASEGRVLFMTTNHIHKLDEALIRAGRCDVHLLIENANADQGRRLFLRFFAGEEKLASTFGDLVGRSNLCMAALQGHLLKHATDAVSAVSHFSEIVNESQAADEGTERTSGELGFQATTSDGEVAESEDVHQDDHR